MSVIQVNNISKHFGSLKAVDGLSFEVQAGQVFGFLGQNGSGKSTTIRMLLSLIHPTSGSIQIFGDSIASNRNKVLEEIMLDKKCEDKDELLKLYDEKLTNKDLITKPKYIFLNQLNKTKKEIRNQLKIDNFIRIKDW